MLCATSATVSFNALILRDFGSSKHSFSRLLMIPGGASCGTKNGNLSLLLCSGSMEEEEIHYVHTANKGL